MTEQEYNRAEGIRRSDLWTMADSPEKFRWKMDHPEEPTPTLTFGAAAHKYILEPETFDDEYAVAPVCDRRTKAGKEEYAAFLETCVGKTVISADDLETIKEMGKALADALTPRFIGLIYGKQGKTETPYFWIDPETKEKCKIKCDRVIRDENGRTIVVDYKTAQSAQTEHFNRAVIVHGYHVQAAMYTAGVQIAEKLDERPRFVFVVQEKKAPYSVNIVEVSYDVMNFGDTVYRELLDRYHTCKELDVWPGYLGTEGEMNQTSLPKWAMNVEEEE